MKVNQSNDLEKDKSVGSFPMFGLLTYPDESSENRRNGHRPLPKRRLHPSP